MTEAVLDSYVDGIPPEARALVTALDAAIRAAHPPLDVAVKYGILTYALGGDWRAWVCAVDAGRHVVSLRFLFGILLSDPLGVLRSGSSVLRTWDLPFGTVIDPVAVGAYVTEAVRTYPHYRANADAILAEARATASARSRRHDG